MSRARPSRSCSRPRPRAPSEPVAAPSSASSLGTPRADTTWGPNVWVEGAGHAVEQAEDVRDLYAPAAARWVEEGLTSQYTVVPASDAPLVDAWFRLGFGQQHVHAVREAPRLR